MCIEFDIRLDLFCRVPGKVKIELNYGSGYRNVTSPVVVGDGEPHSVKVTVDTVNSQLLLMVR